MTLIADSSKYQFRADRINREVIKPAGVSRQDFLQGLSRHRHRPARQRNPTVRADCRYKLVFRHWLSLTPFRIQFIALVPSRRLKHSQWKQPKRGLMHV